MDNKFKNQNLSMSNNINEATNADSLNSEINAASVTSNQSDPVTRSEIGDLKLFREFDSDLVSKIKNEFQERFVNVKWFDAKGDGINDDTEAIQKALDTGYPVFIPSGVYNVTELIPKPGQIIRGANSVRSWGNNKATKETILKGLGSKDNYVIKNQAWWNKEGPFTIVISDLTIDGNNKTTNGILCETAATIERVRVVNCDRGISKVLGSLITNCAIGLNNTGIYQAMDSKIKDNVIFYNYEDTDNLTGGIGIDFSNSNDNIIANNKIEWNGIGLKITGTYNLVTGNIFDRNTTYGIDTEVAPYTSILNNQFERNMVHHIRLYGAYCNITGNSFFAKPIKDDLEKLSEAERAEVETLPEEAIFIWNTGSSIISNNIVVGAKMYSNQAFQYVNSCILDGNMIEGKSDSEIAVPIPETTIESKKSTCIHIPYPATFSMNEWNGRVSGYSIGGMGIYGTDTSKSADSYGAMEGVSIGLRPGHIELTIYNIFEKTTTFIGKIYLKPTRFTTR